MATRPSRTPAAQPPVVPPVQPPTLGAGIPNGNCRPVRPTLTSDQFTMKIRMDKTAKPAVVILHKTDVNANKALMIQTFPVLAEWLSTKNGISAYEVFRDLTGAGWDVTPYHWGS